MGMPTGHTQWYARVQLVFHHALGRGVQRASQLLPVGCFLVEQRGRLRGVKAEGSLQPLPIVGEVIYGLGELGQKRGKPLLFRYTNVFVLF